MPRRFSLKILFAPLWTGKNRFTTLSVLIICAMYGMWMFTDAANKTASSWTAASSQQGQTIKSVGMPAIGGSFELQRALEGGTTELFTEEDLKGKYSLLFFGFTHCPDICPMELSKLDAAYEALSPEQQKQVQVIMVSVDPTRDTPQPLFDYVTAFNEKFIPLTGTSEQVKQAADAYLVYHSVRKEPNQTENYDVDHSGYTYVMNPDGQYMTHFTTHTSVQDIKKELVKQLSQ